MPFHFQLPAENRAVNGTETNCRSGARFPEQSQPFAETFLIEPGGIIAGSAAAP